MSEVMNVPDGWDIKTINDVALKISDGIHTTPIYAENSNYYFINGNNLDNGKIIINEKIQKHIEMITDNELKKEFEKQFIYDATYVSKEQIDFLQEEIKTSKAIMESK